MAVLIEATCVVVRADAIMSRHTGGWIEFRDSVPNGTLVCDNEIASVGFMASQDLDRYISRLQANGLRFLEHGQAQDIAVADQWQGICTPCDWLEFGHMGGEHKRVAACRMVGTREEQFFTPEGWTFEDSASQTLRFIPKDEIEKSLEYVGREKGLDVYRDRLTGKLLYVGRADDGQTGRR